MTERALDITCQVWLEAAGLLAQTLSLEQAAPRLLELMAQRLSTRRARLVLRGQESALPRLVACLEPPAPALAGPPDLEPELWQRLLRVGQPFFLAGHSREPIFAREPGAQSLDRAGLAWLGAPIVWQGAGLGLIYADAIFAPPHPPEEDLDFLVCLAGLAGQMAGLESQVHLREAQLRRSNRFLRGELAEVHNRFLLVGASPAILEVQRLAEKVAPSRASVLLVGERGTGRSTVARIIHEHSARNGFPFCRVACAGASSEVLERELFGHAPGSGDGGEQLHPGRLEQVDGGTLFLDDIDELSLTLQSKLLRFLQDREFEPVGSVLVRRADVRLIAATSRDLARLVDQGRLREDLYYRLAVFPIALPPLRERGQDLGLLLDHFVERLSREVGRTLTFTPAAREALLRYAWPGNLREMVNLVERLLLLGGPGLVDLADLGPLLFHPPATRELPTAEAALSRLEEIELREVVAALERNNWVQSHAARELGLTLRQIGYRIKKFGLEKTIKQQRHRPPAAEANPRRSAPSSSLLSPQPFSL
ncbi:MAG: sigma 54-interacting transcriptional regulator [Desulfarculus sp.]|nr:sigma 54-interacting transcriptional regulator [Desulfarculus sp.]